MKATRCGQRRWCHMACMLLVLCHLEDLAVQFDMKVSIVFTRSTPTCLLFIGHFG